MDQETIDKFWSFADCSDPGVCWIWTGSKRGGHNDNGGRYGQFWDGEKYHYAHRLAYELTYGPIPDGLSCLHKCDIRCCINPAHLFTGTARENTLDMVSKGRAFLKPGVDHFKAKFTEHDVLSITKFYLRGLANQGELARIYNVGLTIISNLLHGKTYRNIPRPILISGPGGWHREIVYPTDMRAWPERKPAQKQINYV